MKNTMSLGQNNINIGLLHQGFKKRRNRVLMVTLCLSVLTLFLALLSLMVGTNNYTLSTVFQVIRE